MKWFANDSDADQDPKIRAIARAYRLRGELAASKYHDETLKHLIANAGIGALWRTWCFVARHGTAVDPATGAPLVGWSLDSRGEPYPLEELAENCDLTVSLFSELMQLAADRGHINADQWRRGVVFFPAMAKRADEYTKKLLARAQPLAPGPDSVPTLSEQCPSTVQDKTSQNSRSPRSRSRRRPKASEVAASPLFAAFWLVWPNKVAKVAALDAWAKAGIEARLDRDELVNDRIIPAVRKQTDAYGWGREDGEYMPHPATWINGARWDDEIDLARVARRQAGRPAPKPRSTGGTGAPAAAKSDRYARLAQGAK